MAPNNISLRVLNTQFEMMEARGYTVPPDLRVSTVMKFAAKYVDAHGMLSNMSNLYRRGETNEHTYVFYSAMQGTSYYTPCKNDIKTFLDFVDAHKKQIICAIFISEMPLSTTNLKVFEAKCITDPKCVIQTYLFDELLFNPTKHVLVPKHRLLTQDEQTELYKQFGKSLVDPRPTYRTTKNHKDNVMPVLRLKDIHGGDLSKNENIGDPIAKWYFARPSDVFEITRRNNFADTTVAESVVYKYVV